MGKKRSREKERLKPQPDEKLFSTAVPSEAGVTVTDEGAMRLATVNACVRVLAEDVSILPLHVYRRTPDGGKERATEHPLYALLHDEPNGEMDSMAFRQALMVNLLLEGNGYALREYNRAGRLRALWPLLSADVMPYRDAIGNLMYRINGMRVHPEEILHIPGLSFNGVRGMNPIEYARESIGMGVAAETFGAKFFKNGTHMGGVVTVPGVFGDEAYERTKAQFNQVYRGLQNAHGIILLEDGAKFDKIGISPNDAQFLETRKYQRTEIAALYRVPLHMIGDLEHATFSNIEHQDISYLQRSLTPWLTRFERAMHRQLLTQEEKPELIIEHDTAGFLRGDTLTRYQAYSAGINAGFLMPNEARVAENRNPAAGGWKLMQPLNMQPVETSRDDARTGKKRSRYADFIAGSERRTADDDDFAAVPERTGISKEIFRRLADALAALAKKQLEAVLRLIDELRSLRADKPQTTPDKIMDLSNRVNSYYNRLENNGYKALGDEWGAMQDALHSAFEKTWKQLAGELGDEMPNETWRQRLEQKYAEKARERLITADKNEILRLITGSETLEEVEKGLNEKYRLKMQKQDAVEHELQLLSNRAKSAAYDAAGYFSKWNATGSDLCPACVNMNGKHICRLHPPLHLGCECYITKDEKFVVPPTAGAGEWANAGFKNSYAAVAHEKHLTEFGDISYNDYVEIARALLSAKSSDVILEYRGSEDRIAKYDTQTNTLAIYENGAISTCFKPKDKKAYWEEKFANGSEGK